MSDSESRCLCLQWSVPGKPVPQKRHRHRFSGGVWDPSSSDKQVFLDVSKQLCPVNKPLACALRVELHFVFPRPKAHYTKKGAFSKRAPKHHVQTPDTDNLAKYVLDALSKTYYNDDRQVISLNILKSWGKSGCTHVRIRTVGETDSPPNWND